MDQLRIYTLRTAEALDRYASVHRPRHVATMPQFGATVRGVWTERAPAAHRPFALLAFQDGVDPDQFAVAYVASPEFASDMEGFDLGDIVHAEDVRLDPLTASPVA